VEHLTKAEYLAMAAAMSLSLSQLRQYFQPLSGVAPRFHAPIALAEASSRPSSEFNSLVLGAFERAALPQKQHLFASTIFSW